MQAAALAEPFGDEVIASWITSQDGLQEVFNSESQLYRLISSVADKNKVVIVSSCAGKSPARGCGFKLVVLYREKKK